MSGTDLSVDRAAPNIAYTAMDRAAIYSMLVNYMQSLPDNKITDISSAQIVNILIMLMSALGDVAFYRIDVVARELFSATARQLSSMSNIAKPFGYSLGTPESATVTLTLVLDPLGSYPTTIKHSEQYSNGAVTDEVFFQPINDVLVASYPISGTVDINAIEGELYESVLIGVSTGAQNQRIQLPQSNVIISSISLLINGVLWSRVPSWSGATSTSMVFIVKYDNKGHVFVIFGDGNFGAVPATNATITSTFRVGGGTRGNLPGSTDPTKASITTKVSTNNVVKSIYNKTNSSGGTDFETVQHARYAIPASLSALNRGVTLDDFTSLAINVAGVVKAAGKRVQGNIRTVAVLVAPTGGGQPSNTLKNQVSTSLSSKRMASVDIDLSSGFKYINLDLSWVIHVKSTFKESVVLANVQSFFTNSNGTGQYDFSQLNPGALSGAGNPLLSQTVLQNYMTNLAHIGVDWLQVEKFTIIPTAFVKDGGNIGNGSVSSVVITGFQRRREFLIVFTSATQFTVTERIVGRITDLSDATLTDTTKDFLNDSVASYAGYLLAPLREISTFLPVASVTAHTINIVPSSNVSLFAITAVGEEYYLFNPHLGVGLIGTPFTSSDNTVTFTVTASSTPFIAGDSFRFDVFPNVSDIILRKDEYPQLLTSNFALRTVGGLK